MVDEGKDKYPTEKIAMDDDDETITAAQLSAGTPRKK